MAFTKIKSKKAVVKSQVEDEMENMVDPEHKRINSMVDDLNCDPNEDAQKKAFIRKVIPLENYASNEDVEKQEEIMGEDLDGDDEEGESATHKKKVLPCKGLGLFGGKSPISITIGISKGK